MRKPFWNRRYKCWYVEIRRGKHVRLDPDKETAFKLYHEIMAGQKKPAEGTVDALFREFLTWTKRNRAERTFKFAADVLAGFIEHVGVRKRVADLRPIHAQDWLDTYFPSSRCNDTTRNIQGDVVKRAFSWAARMGLIDDSPIRKWKLPAALSRDAYLTAEQWNALVEAVEKRGERDFLDAIKMMKLTGCRPQELRAFEARHWQDNCMVFAAGEAPKGKGERVIHLDDESLAIVCRRALKWPEGRLFRNSRGRPWRKDSLVNACHRYAKRLGYPVFPYAIRHTFATDAILRGVDLISIAALMGHADLKMLQRVYAHVQRRADHLRDALRRINGRDRDAG